MSASARTLPVWVVACLLVILLGGVPAEGQEPPRTPPSTPTAVVPQPVATSASGSGGEVAIHTKRRPGVPARAAALLLSGQQGGPIGVSGLAVPVLLGAGGVRLSFVVDVDGSSLLAGVETPTLPVEIAVYAVNPKGGVGGSVVEAFDLNVERAAEVLVGGGIKFFGTLDLPAAPYALRVLVRNVRLGTFGALEVPRVLPVGDEPFAFLSPPLVAEPSGAWLLAREAGRADPLHPFPFLGEGMVPSTAPVLPGGTVTRFWVMGRGLAAGTTSLSVRVLDTGGHELAKVQAAVTDRRDTAVTNTTALRLEFTLPAMAPGQYSLEVSGPSMNPDIPLWSSTRFLMAEKSAAERPQVWVRFALPAATAGGSVRPPAAFVGKAGRVKASPAIKRSYRSALLLLPTDPAAAHNAVAELEAASLPTGKAAEWETLVLSEAEVAHEIGGVRPDAVLALVLLHADLQRAYALRNAYLLESHARRMVQELAVLSAGMDKSPEGKALAANALASLGGSLQQPGTMATSERVFRMALEIDPGNAAAMMAVAATLEKVGLYKLALKQLEELAKAKPDDAEARLRLAINVARIGSDGRAHELLQACAAPGNPEWIRAVAYQELARRLIESGRFGQAEHLLREALAALPGDGGLTVQLAYVLDRQHRPVEAQVLARDVSTHGIGVDTSPRFRYSEWPSQDLEGARAALEAAAPAAHNALVAALAAGGRGAAGGRP